MEKASGTSKYDFKYPHHLHQSQAMEGDYAHQYILDL